MKYFKKIVGDKVYLSPMNSDDYLKYTEWLNDYDVAKGVNQYVNMISINGEKEWLENAINDKYTFAVVCMNNDELIGNISLMNVSNIDKTAELGIMIGNKKYHSCGYGSEAIIILLNYAFKHVNLNNIMLKVYSFNTGAIKAYEKCGFKTFGVWKNSHYFDGEYVDEIFMNVLKEDFYKNEKVKKLCK